MPIFDAHFHIIDPKYPLQQNYGFIPDSFTIKDYLRKVKDFEITGGTVVSGSFQGFDQAYLIDTLNQLGNGFFGVANIPVDYPSAKLERLHQAGVRAVRFNLMRGGSESIKHLQQLSLRLFSDYGWHTELYVDGKDLPHLYPRLGKLSKCSIDHLGLTKSGLPTLYKLAAQGAKVKATGFGRLDFSAIPVMQKIYEINPEALMFGTDLPSTRAKVPFSATDVQLIRQNFDDEAQERIFLTNASIWYQK